MHFLTGDSFLKLLGTYGVFIGFSLKLLQSRSCVFMISNKAIMLWAVVVSQRDSVALAIAVILSAIVDNVTSDKSSSSDLFTSHPFEGVDVQKALFCSEWKFVTLESGLSDVKVRESCGIHAELCVPYNNYRKSICTFSLCQFMLLASYYFMNLLAQIVT